MGDVRWDDPNFIKRPEEYNNLISYSQVKSAMLIFARALAKRGVSSFAVHPGSEFMSQKECSGSGASTKTDTSRSMPAVLTNLFDATLKEFFIKNGMSSSL